MPSDIEADPEWTKDIKTVTFRREDEIDDIETYFIKRAAKVNKKLKNKYKRKESEWFIIDVVGKFKAQGRKKSPIPEFCQMMGIRRK